jgi:hypothetical protein
MPLGVNRRLPTWLGTSCVMLNVLEEVEVVYRGGSVRGVLAR